MPNQVLYFPFSGNTRIWYPSTKEIHPSINAEVKMAAMLVHHNTFFNLLDHMMQYVTTEFKGSPAAENFSGGCTKTSVIVNCIGNILQEQLIQDMKN